MPIWEQRWEQTTVDAATPVAARELTDGSALIAASAGSGIVAVRYDHLGVVLSSATIRAPYLDWLSPQTQTRCFIDPFGGVFVSAVSDVDLTRGDAWLMKYDGFTGKPVWAAPRIFDGATHQLDVTVRVLFDRKGDATWLVSSRSGSVRNAVLIKYEGVSGAPLWGPTIIPDLSSLVTAIDPTGDVVLSGSRTSSSIFDRMETYKFDGQTGNRLWGAAVFGGMSSDTASGAIDVGLDGNVVVAATSSSGVTLHKYAGPNGAVIWGPVSFGAGGPFGATATGVTIGPSGDVVLSATSQNQFHTLQYSGATGRRLWGAVTETGNGNSTPPTVALAGNGDVIVSSWAFTGMVTELATWRYDGETGSTIWGPKLFAGSIFDLRRPILFFASNGRIFSAAPTLAVERDPLTGDPVWGPSPIAVNTIRSSHVNDLTHDPAGNVIVTGATTGSPFVTIKYNRTTGTVMWGPVFHTIAPSGAYVVRTDASGDVFILGYDGALVLLKYSGSTGAVLWGPIHISNVFPRQLAVAPSGDLFVAGELPNVSDDDIALLKFSGATGATLWGPMTFNGGPGRKDFPAAVSATPAGDVVVAGMSIAVGFTSEWVTLKYSGASGSLLWGPVTLAGTRVSDLTIDTAGNAIVVGEAGTLTDMATIKYNGDTGGVLWGPQLVNGSGNYVDGAYAVVLDGNGDVFVTGTVYTSTSEFDFGTVKYNGATGSLLWGPVLFNSFRSDFAYAIGLDASGNPVVAGESDNLARNSDIVLVTYDGTTGAHLWSAQRVGGFGDDLLPLHNLSVRGSSAVIAGTSDNGFLTVAFDEVFGIATLQQDIPPLYCDRAASIPLIARNLSGAVTWSVVSGSLPPGLTLGASSGLISGPPAALGTFSFRVRASDTLGPAVERDFVIDVFDGSDFVEILTTAEPLCPGQMATLSVAGIHASYMWLPGGQTSSSIDVSPTETTDYGVFLGSGTGCRVRGYLRLAVGPLPVNITAPEPVAPSSAGHPATVDDFGPGATYVWSILNASITAGAGTRQVTFSVGVSGSVALEVTVTTAAGCSRTVSRSIPIAVLGFYTVAPCRVFDTRWIPPAPAIPLAPGSTRVFQVAGQCGIPSNARAVAVNLTVIDPTAPGHLRLYPAGTLVPFTSTVNYGVGQTRASNAIVGLGENGDVAVDSGQASGTAHALMDVTGYFQ